MRKVFVYLRVSYFLVINFMKKTILTLGLVLALLVGFDYLNAWTVPVATAPGGNVATPVNIGDEDQIKSAAFAATELLSSSSTAGILMMSPKYCDLNGENCWDPSSGAPGLNTSENTLSVYQCPVQPSRYSSCYSTCKGQYDLNESCEYGSGYANSGENTSYEGCLYSKKSCTSIGEVKIY